MTRYVNLLCGSELLTCTNRITAHLRAESRKAAVLQAPEYVNGDVPAQAVKCRPQRRELLYSLEKQTSLLGQTGSGRKRCHYLPLG